MTPLPTRGWEAHLQVNPMMRTLQVVLFRPIAGMTGEFVEHITERGTETLRVGTDAESTTPAALSIPEDVAAALFGALLEHFGGPGADRELRADYLHERGRVDRLIELVTRPPQVIRYDTGQVQAQ